MVGQEITAAGSPDTTDGTSYFGGDFGWVFFWPIQASIVVGEPLGDATTPS